MKPAPVAVIAALFLAAGMAGCGAVKVTPSGPDLRLEPRPKGCAIEFLGKAPDRAYEEIADQVGRMLNVPRVKVHLSRRAVSWLARLMEGLGQNPFLATGPEIGGGRIVPLGGGIPIREGSQVVGGVGVSGGTAEQDIECAQAGLAQL